MNDPGRVPEQPAGINKESLTQCIRVRQQALRGELDRRNLALFVVTKPANLQYLTGFRGSAGLGLFTASGASLLVDPRYSVQARNQAVGVEVIEIKSGLLRAAARRLRKQGRKRVGFEDAHLTWAEFEVLRREANSSISWQSTGGLVEELRAVKDALEIDQIREAGKLTADVFQEIAKNVRAGGREQDLAAEIDYKIRQHGGEGAAFETIVASGPRGALPHARPSEKALTYGELVIFDFGAIHSGYAADMTRTLYLGTPDRRIRSLYNSVLEAQREGIERLRAGVKAADVDFAARKQLATRNLEEFFTHSTGHGVGLEIHERPRIGEREKSRIVSGSVVTVEPGIYIEGFGGIRIEDTLLVTQDGREILTPAPKDDWWIA
jgi:Xaa-Pro aminopeptidase